jgi:hypothetical protein
MDYLGTWGVGQPAMEWLRATEAFCEWEGPGWN